MPFWLYTLGRMIFQDTAIKPPVRSIFTTLGSMVIFLGIGLLIKRFFPNVAKVNPHQRVFGFAYPILRPPRSVAAFSPPSPAS